MGNHTAKWGAAQPKRYAQKGLEFPVLLLGILHTQCGLDCVALGRLCTAPKFILRTRVRSKSLLPPSPEALS